jgi:hypothetical protein
MKLIRVCYETKDINSKNKDVNEENNSHEKTK